MSDTDPSAPRGVVVEELDDNPRYATDAVDAADLDAHPVTEPHPAERSAPEHTPLRRRRNQLLSFAVGHGGVAVFAAFLGCVAWRVSSSNDLAMMYADSRSHLTIARRLLDGDNASMVQLGTVWLPLPHVIVAPLTLFDSWWRSGFAAFPINLAALIIQALALFRIVVHASRSRVGGWIAVALLCTNPGWLYLHTTSLGEPVVFAALLVTISGLSGWIRSDKPYSGGELTVFVGLPAAAGVLSRYDGWAMALAVGAFVVVIAQVRWRQWRYSLRCLRGFAVAPTIAALWWFWFNWVNWGDPLEFQRGQYSAQAQQDILDRAGLLPDKGDWGRSISTYLQATTGGAGRALVIAAIAAAVLWLLVGRWRPRALPVWLLIGVPTGFYVLSLYTGQIALRLGDGADASMFNLRYGLQTLPGLAAITGIALSTVGRGWSGPTTRWRDAIAVVLGAAVIAISVASFSHGFGSIPVIAEGIQQRELGDDAWAGATYLHTEAVSSGGAVVGQRTSASTPRILIDDSINPMLPVIAANLSDVTAPFSGPRWADGLDDLSESEWIFADFSGEGDAVAKAIDADPAFARTFDEVFRSGNVAVYRREAP